MTVRLLGELRVALLERVYAALRVDEGLLPREVRMAGGAGVDLHLLLRGTGVDDVAARARDRRVTVVGMDSVFHLMYLSKIERVLYLIPVNLSIA